MGRPIRRCVAAIAALLAAAAPAHAHSAYNFDFSFGPPQITAPDAISVDPGDGEVFAADGGRVVVFGPTGTPGRTFGQAAGAVGVSPAPPYDVYTLDPGGSRIDRYTNAGAPLGSFNAAGARAIAFDPSGSVYVASAGGITRYAPDGTAPTAVSSTGFTQLGADTRGLLGIDAGNNLAQRLGFDGTPGQRFGSGSLDAPHAITADADGNVFVADTGHHRIAVFDPGAAPVASFGLPGSGEGEFQMLAGLAYSPFNRHVYAVDTVNALVTAWKPIPQPSLGNSMDIQTDAGSVRYREPGASRFTNLTAVTRVPSGTIIDATNGTVGITSVTDSGQLQSADFYKGVFRAVQARGAHGLTEAQLFGGAFNRCPAGLRAAKVPQTIRRLWGSGAGKFRTKGRFATSSIRGTTWLTEDRCDGTLIRVTQGAVTVQDFVRRKSIVLHVGQRYFARAHP